MRKKRPNFKKNIQFKVEANLAVPSPAELAHIEQEQDKSLDRGLFDAPALANKTPMDLVQAALADPIRARKELLKSICHEDFFEFVRQSWPILEPSTKFIDGQAMRTVCRALQAITEGKIRRLLINIPPGFAKSLLVCVFWPAWEWGPRNLKHHRFISASYEQGLATRDLVRGRDLVMSKWFQDLWPIELKEDLNEKTYYGNTETGWRKSTSVGGALTGYRGDRILIDDPHDVKRAHSEIDRAIALRWWTQTLPTRFNDPQRSAIVLIMQRLHVDDLSGHIIEKTPDGWVKLILPMEYDPNRHCKCPEINFEDWRTQPNELLWPEQYPRAEVDMLKATMSAKDGRYAVAGQLQQSPIPEGGGRLKRELINYVDEAPPLARRVRGWDLAATEGGGDYTAGAHVALHQGRIYITDMIRFQGSSFQVIDRMKKAAAEDGPTTPISIPQDPGQSGKHQRLALAGHLGGYDIHFSSESGSKADRARPLAAQWEAGNVFLVRAPWNDTFLDEAARFPAGKGHDDQIDAVTRAYAYLLAHEVGGISLTAGYTVENLTSSLDDF